MIDSYEAWLAAMPVDDIDSRIGRLEAELATLRLVQQLRNQTVHRAPSRSDPTAESHAQGQSVKRSRAGRLTKEREAIISTIRDRPSGMSPRDVAATLRRTGNDFSDNAIAANMSRMASFGMLQRVEQGLYRLPAHIPAASLLEQLAAGEPEVSAP